MCSMNGLNIQLRSQYKQFIAGALSSLSLSLANEKEISILTMIIYPRATEVIYKMMVQKGYLREFKHSDILAFMFCCSFIVYCYIFEPSNLPSNYIKAINNFSLLTKGEGTMFATVTEQVTRQIEQTYGVPR
ncbi:UNKNOWN [Stylonychia lemnae]|uniref:Uncharacterized protein n=1 Tax=Stylonychia lemnae TaxID=5949 RepID=A0A078ATI0_STYLE|nr:UNKNOWN [Stylonychia lemnae]|eukprot:CDW84492.1 UNKNOWN [Stylonychia lemnae]